MLPDNEPRSIRELRSAILTISGMGALTKSNRVPVYRALMARYDRRHKHIEPLVDDTGKELTREEAFAVVGTTYEAAKRECQRYEKAQRK
jgi:hypothetical protein